MLATANGSNVEIPSDDEVYCRPLIGAAVVFIGGLLVGGAWPGHLLLAGLVFLIAAAVCIFSLIRWQHLRAAPLMLFTALGYMAIQPWLTHHLAEDHIQKFIGSNKWCVFGIIADHPQFAAGRLRFVLDADRLSDDQDDLSVRGKVRVSVRGHVPALNRGDRIQVAGYLYGIRNFNNPGGFDYERYMAFQGVRARMSTRPENLKVLQGSSSSSAFLNWRTRVDICRQDLGEDMDKALASHGHQTSAVLKALIIGDRSGITHDLRDQFNRAGVGHVLAISGLHIGLVAAAVFWAAVNIFVWIPCMLRWAWTRKGAALISMIAVGSYALLAGMSPSTQRASIVATVFLLTYWIGRRHDWLNAAALAALLIAIFHPPSVFSISFQLSFAAVLVILGGIRNFTPRGEHANHRIILRWGQRIVVFVCISTLAIAGTLPLVMAYFNQVSVVGVVVNLVVVPLVGWMVIPFGLAGALADAFSLGMAHILWQVAGFGVDAVLAITTWVSTWPYTAVKTISSSLLEILIYYLLVGLLLNWRAFPLRKTALALLVIMAMGDASFWVYQRYLRKDLRLTVLDVGQGSANLLQLPGGETVLVDGGGFGDNATFDVGRSIVGPYLWRQKIKHVDLVVLTHPNSDHFNGLIYILEHFNVDEVWSNHEPADTKGYEQWTETIRRHNISHPPFGQLPRRIARHGVVFEILAPEIDFIDHRRHAAWRNENEDSLVLQVSKGDDAFLFCGDIGERTEAMLLKLKTERELASTVLLVPHHGSRNSSSLAFLNTVNPVQAVVSCGWHNRYGFPHPDVLQRLAALPCAVWRTDIDGAIRLSTHGKGMKVQPTLHQSTLSQIPLPDPIP